MAHGDLPKIHRCAHNCSTIWHMVPQSIPSTRLTAVAAARGISIAWEWCFAQHQWLRPRQRNHVARDPCSIHGLHPRQCHLVTKSMSTQQLMVTASHLLATAALLDTWCLAPYQRLHSWQQHHLAHSACLDIIGVAHGSSIVWHVVPHSIPTTALTTAAWRDGTCSIS